MYLLFTDIT